MNFSDYPFLRYLPFFIAGTIFAKISTELPWILSFIPVLVLWVAYVMSVFSFKYFSVTFSGILAYSLLFFLGHALVLGKKESNTPKINWQGVDSYLAEATTYDVPKTSSSENLLEVLAIRVGRKWQPAQGKVLIYHQSSNSLQPGEVVLINKIPESIPPPSFPDEFDYRGFLAKEEIHFRQRVGREFLIIDSAGIQNPRYALDRLGFSLAQLIQSHVSNPQSQQIALALLLGQKGSLDKEIRDAYAETGTMHILAVSGLHVGIIYAMLLLPVRALRPTSRVRSFYLILVVLVIWVYALLTGFSPSVVRAATMFSLMTLGQMRKRKSSIWNILAFSAILILVTDPDVIFDIGFQLSYLAVAGIVGLQPLIVRWWLPRNSILEYFWQLAAVSLAAQLVTFPLSLLYFHQFPTYFLVANLLVVPLAFLIMSVGVPFLFLGWIPYLGEVLGWVINGLIFVQNQLTSLIQMLPGGKIDRLTITYTGMMLVWGLLLIWRNWEVGNKKRLLVAGVLLFGCWIGEGLLRELSRPAQQFRLFKNQKGSLIDLRVGEHHLTWNQSFPPEQISFSINPNRIEEERSGTPHPLRGALQDSAVWFPGFDFRFFLKNGEIKGMETGQGIDWE